MWVIACIVATAVALDNGLAARPGLGWNSDVRFLEAPFSRWRRAGAHGLSPPPFPNTQYCTDCSHVDAAGRLRPGVAGFQNEAFIKHIADFINASGLQALGYTNVNMDSLWDLPTRDANGDLQPDPALWPSGFDYIVSYVHARGLGFGVYGDRGNLDCNRNPCVFGFGRHPHPPLY